ncbi:AAA family ATPase, partial [Bacillus sp. JJ864]|uniref:AAA family ATPase n=1 Tax=Bacillus sp. JJ864 TaxID=3122975 RepID=UPI002FFE106B
MRIKWVEIRNFRSIKNSKRFYLNSKFNILAGKNESGKSNVLKALKSFSDNKFIEEDKCHYSNEDPSVKVCFVVDGKEELENIFTNQYKYSKNISEFIIERRGSLTHFSGDIADVVLNAGVKFYEMNEEKFNTIIKSVNSLLEDLSTDYDVNIFDGKDGSSNLDLSEYRGFLDCLRSNIWDEQGDEYDYGDDVIIDALKSSYRGFKSLMIDGDQFSSFLYNLIPNIILFNSFEDHLPEFITEEDIEKSVIKNFFSLTSCNPESLFNVFGKERSKLINSISTTVTGDFQNYYNQDKIKIKMNADGERVYFEIYDDNDDINPFFISQRSQGFQWFLSFFITLNAEKKQNSVILIDEPGLFLHAKAQQDVLEMLINLSEKHQIVITTHSPYFIDPDRLDRVSLVIKDELTYTYVENKVHKGSDYTTLTPIITAIGLDITRNIGFSRDFNIITEGISDYYYLQVMKEYLRRNYVLIDFNIIPAQGVN